MKELKRFDFGALPIDEISKKLEEIFPSESVVDVDKEKYSLGDGVNKFENSPSASLTNQTVGFNSGLPQHSFGPRNLNDVDGQSLEHMPIIWDAIKEVALNTQAPGRMVVMCALSTFSTIAQGLFDVKSPLGSTHPLSLNTNTIALSGERKTTVDNYFTRVFSEFSKVANGSIQDINKNFSSELGSWEIENKHLKRAYTKALKKGDASEEQSAYQTQKNTKPKKLDHLMMVHDDFSIGALLQGLHSNIPVASIMTSEGAKVLDDANMKCIPLLNKLWDGDEVQVSRVSRQSFWLNDARLSTSLMIQPDVLNKILLRRYDELRSSGYFARSLVCYPQSNIGNRTVLATKKHTEKLDLLYARLAELIIQLLRSLTNNDFERQELKLDQEAEHMWLQFANDIELKMNKGGIYELATDHASKLPENVLRTAGVLHAVAFTEGNISVKTLNAAIQICLQSSQDFMAWFIPPPQDEIDGQKLHKYLLQNYGIYLQGRLNSQIFFHERFIRKNKIRQCGPLKNSDRLNQALASLARQGVIVVTEEVRPQSKGTVYIDLLPSLGPLQYSGNNHPLRQVMIN